MKNSLSKTLGWIYISIIVGFITTVGVMFFYYSNNEYQQRTDEINTILTKYSERIRVYCNEYDRKAYGVANVGTIFWELEKNKTKHDSYTDTVIMNYLINSSGFFPEAGGIGIWFEPYSFIKDRKFYGPYAYWKGKNVLGTWFYNTEEYDYFKWDWYTSCIPKDWDRKIKRPKKAYWSKPYLDPEFLKEYLVTIGAPIYNYESCIVGMTSVDMSLKKLYSYFDTIKITPNSYAFVITPQTRTILSFPYDSTFNLKSVDSLPWLANIFNLSLSRSDTIHSVIIKGVEYNIYLYKPHSHFILGIMASKADIMLPIYQALAYASVFVIFLIIIVIILVKLSLNKITSLALGNKELSEYLTLIMDTVPDAIAVYDINGELIDSNSIFKDYFGNSKYIFDNFSVDSIFLSINHNKLLSDKEKIDLLNESALNSECRKKDGTNFHALIRIVKFLREDKNLILVVFTDITKLIETQNEIKALNKELEKRVLERTAKLNEALDDLKVEISEKEKARLALAQSNEELNLLNQTIAQDTHRLIILNEDLAKSENALKEANATKDKFFAIIAHDLKNPLHAIQLSGDLLKETLKANDNSNEIELAGIITRSTKFLNDLLNNLLIWSSSQSGRLEFVPQALCIYDLFNKVANGLREQAANKNISIVIESTQEHWVFADINMIETVIRNLASNAIKFTHPQGVVKMKSEALNNRVLVTIEDNGVGIPPANIAKIFKLDSSISTPGTASEKGTGLGLTLCSEFIQRHGGMIKVYSELGVGSKFSFNLSEYADLND